MSASSIEWTEHTWNPTTGYTKVSPGCKNCYAAGIRFLSVEPLLEDLGELDLGGIDWVIVGGESGPKARPMKPEWAENVQKQAASAGCAFFFKQWGAWGADGQRRHKTADGRLLKGKTWDAMPEMRDSPQLA